VTFSSTMRYGRSTMSPTDDLKAFVFAHRVHVDVRDEPASSRCAGPNDADGRTGLRGTPPKPVEPEGLSQHSDEHTRPPLVTFNAGRTRGRRRERREPGREFRWTARVDRARPTDPRLTR
jgi:hypothetical protein